MVSLLEKPNFFFEWSNNSGAIDVKMNESVLEAKLCFKMLGLYFFSKLDWDSYIASIAKTTSKIAFDLYKCTISPYLEYCSHVWCVL